MAEAPQLPVAAPAGPHRGGLRRSATGPLRFEWLTRVEELERIEAPWRELEEGVSERMVFGSFDFMVPWYRHVAAVEGAPLVGAAWRGRELAGLLPLTYRRASLRKVPVRRADSAFHDGAAGELLVPEGKESVLAGLLESLLERGGLDVLLLNGLVPGSGRLDALEGVTARRGLALEHDPYRYATIDLSLGYAAYERALSGNLRGTLRRRRKRADRMGGFGVERIHEPIEAGALAPRLARLYRISERSWKAKQGDPMKEHYRRFYAEIAQRFARRGMLDLAFLTVGGQDASYILGLRERGVYYDVTVSFVEEFAGLSPGTVLLQEVARGLAEEGIGRVVSHGDHAYKNSWTSAWVPQVRAIVFLPGLRGYLSRLVWRRAPLIARQFPWLAGRSSGPPSHPETSAGSTSPEGPRSTSSNAPAFAGGSGPT